jgi:hypothetical protein
MQIIVPQAVGLHLKRADEELVALHTDIVSYLSRRPYRARVERDRTHADRGRIVLRIEEQAPDHISIRLGECIESWHAALDTFAFIIARRHSGCTAYSGFPIFMDADAFAGPTNRDGPALGSGLYKIRGMKSSAQAIIERLQPYNGGREGDPLWMLHELSGAAKEGSTDPVCSVQDGSTYKVGVHGAALIIKDVQFLVGPARDNGTIGHVLVSRWDQDLGRSVTFDLDCGLAFPDNTDDAGRPLSTNGRLINVTTKLIRDAVWDTCWRLRFFTGRKGAETIESAPLAPISPVPIGLWAT